MKYNMTPSHRTRLVGWIAAFTMVLIGAGWQLATRAGARAALAPIDLALLRYLIPALILAPAWWRVGLLPVGVARSHLALVVAGAGLPFGLLAMAGASLAPVAHMGVLLPGASPMLVALVAWLWLGTRPSRHQLIGLPLLGVGLALITVPSSAAGQALTWLGDLLFLGASLLWAFYTLALRRTGLSPWASAGLVSAWSALAVVPLWGLAYLTGRTLMFTASTQQVLLQVLFQGLIAGVAGLAVFGLAVRNLGPAAASSVGALVPSVVALGGWLLLGEALDAWAWVGVATVVAGVWLAGRPSASTATPLAAPPTSAAPAAPAKMQ